MAVGAEETGPSTAESTTGIAAATAEPTEAAAEVVSSARGLSTGAAQAAEDLARFTV